MPHREPEKYLYDMLSSCEFLLDFTAGKTIDDYIKDRAFRSALERELQIIGEALIQLEDIAPEIAEQIPEYQNIIGFRHVLVHGYANLDPATVWNVVETKLESLAKKLKSLLE
ncbi:MAG: hypothetical protein A2173_07920 [Planctomycetes bacterium RBG_13_44_8b]|nr:MAG: hypothetical protein A2173_07920 [Planctomycetes bacterium RBG_13_44_8b]